MLSLKKHSNKIWISIILILLIIFLISFKYVLEYYFLISNQKETIDILSKILPPLLGAFFSGIVAIIIFVLTKYKEELTKKNNSSMYVDLIQEEIKSNTKLLTSIKNLFDHSSPEQLATELMTDEELLRIFKNVSSQVSIEIIDKFLLQLNKEDYLKIMPLYKKYQSLLITLKLITEDTDKQAESLPVLLGKLKSLIVQIEKRVENEPSSEPLNKPMNKSIEQKINLILILIFICILGLIYTIFIQ